MAEITPTLQKNFRDKTFYKVISTANADTFTIDVLGADQITIQAENISADTIVVEASVDIDGNVFTQILDSDDINPFAAPTANVLQTIEVANFAKIKVTRSGVADGTINIYYSENNV